jgi:ABC-type sugar transport system ATPase subunit
MEEVLNISDRVAVMHEGRVTGILERNECTEEKRDAPGVGR